MLSFDGLMSFLDNRSFVSVWYWIIAIGMWPVLATRVIGVPVGVITRAQTAVRQGDAEGPAVFALLDWLSLTVPAWRPTQRAGAGFVGMASFLLTSLIILGFGYGLQLAQAVALLIAPLLLLLWMRVRLAGRIATVLHAAQRQDGDIATAAAEIIRRLGWHRIGVTILAFVAVAITSFWGAVWVITHPNGL